MECEVGLFGRSPATRAGSTRGDDRKIKRPPRLLFRFWNRTSLVNLLLRRIPRAVRSRSPRWERAAILFPLQVPSRAHSLSPTDIFIQLVLERQSTYLSASIFPRPLKSPKCSALARALARERRRVHWLPARICIPRDLRVQGVLLIPIHRVRGSWWISSESRVQRGSVLARPGGCGIFVENEETRRDRVPRLSSRSFFRLEVKQKCIQRRRRPSQRVWSRSFSRSFSSTDHSTAAFALDTFVLKERRSTFLRHTSLKLIKWNNLLGTQNVQSEHSSWKCKIHATKRRCKSSRILRSRDSSSIVIDNRWCMIVELTSSVCRKVRSGKKTSCCCT